MDYTYDNMYHQVPFIIQRTSATGWKLEKDALRVGRSGLVGDWWKELQIALELEIESAALDGGLFVWTDAVALPLTSSDLSVELVRDEFNPNLYKVLSAHSVTSLNLLYADTDLHKTEGLSTYRSIDHALWVT